MGEITKEALFAGVGKRHVEAVELPELGVTAYVREMTCVERDRWEDGWARWREVQNGDPKDTRYYYVYLLVHTLCDEKGNLLCNEDDVRRLGDVPATHLRRVFDAARRVNFPRDIEKNSESDPSV